MKPGFATDSRAAVWSVAQIRTRRQEGFTLPETLIALLVLGVGLLAASGLLCVTLRSLSLSRSKDAASTAAQSMLDHLATLYSRNPGSTELALGHHGPEQVTIRDPNNDTVVNSFRIGWDIEPVGDPRPGKVLQARTVTVTVTPAQASGAANIRLPLNKVVNMSSVLSPRVP